MTFPHPQRESIIHFLKTLRERMIIAFEEIEIKNRFSRKKWDYKQEGGGEIALLRGEIFEKAAVNWSGVGGDAYPFAKEQGKFFATGISLISHMANPHAPTAHFNIRFIETETKYWFGGGFDLTPMGFEYEEDKLHFHHVAKQTLELFGKGVYEKFSQNAREYFYIPHHKKERGAGGVFFDLFSTGDFEADIELWKAIGNCFLEALLPIYERRILQPYNTHDRETQLHCRAHYVEFNLLYDRGTRFGFESGGNPEAILCSMPPLVKW